MRLLENMHEIMEAHYREVYDKPDWVYRDTPHMDIKLWTELSNTVGEDNLIVVSGSRIQKKGKAPRDTFRCSMLISPQGLENLKELSNDS